MASRRPGPGELLAGAERRSAAGRDVPAVVRAGRPGQGAGHGPGDQRRARSAERLGGVRGDRRRAGRGRGARDGGPGGGAGEEPAAGAGGGGSRGRGGGSAADRLPADRRTRHPDRRRRRHGLRDRPQAGGVLRTALHGGDRVGGGDHRSRGGGRRAPGAGAQAAARTGARGAGAPAGRARACGAGGAAAGAGARAARRARAGAGPLPPEPAPPSPPRAPSPAWSRAAIDAEAQPAWRRYDRRLGTRYARYFADRPELAGEQRTSARDLVAALPPGWEAPADAIPDRPWERRHLAAKSSEMLGLGLLGVAATRDPSLAWLWDALEPLPVAAGDAPSLRFGHVVDPTLLGERPRPTTLDVLVDDPSVLIGLSIKWREHGVGGCSCRGEGVGPRGRRPLLAPGRAARRLLGRGGGPARSPRARPRRPLSDQPRLRDGPAGRRAQRAGGHGPPRGARPPLRRRQSLLRAHRRLAGLARPARPRRWPARIPSASGSRRCRGRSSSPRSRSTRTPAPGPRTSTASASAQCAKRRITLQRPARAGPVLGEQVRPRAVQQDAHREDDQDGVVELAGDGDEVRHQVDRRGQVDDHRDEQRLAPPLDARVRQAGA